MLFTRASFLGLVGAGLLACVGDAPITNPGTDSGVDAVADVTSDTGPSTDGPVEAGPAFDPTGLVLWLDAKKVTTTAGKVTTWPDQSGKGNDAMHAVASEQPGYASGVQNGLPGVNFAPGTYLEIPKGAGFDDFSAGLSVFVAARPTGPAAQGLNYFLMLAPDTDAAFPPNMVEFKRAADSDAIFQLTDGSGWANDILRGSAVVKDEFALFETVMAGASVTLYKNGTSIVSSSTFGTLAKVARTRNRVGGGSKEIWDTMEGPFGEVILFATGLSDLKRKEVEKYLMTKWNL